MRLTIITRDKQIFEGSIHSVTLPGSAGSFQILEHHAPLISTLTSGKVSYISMDLQQSLFIKEGIAEVYNNTVNLLVEV